MLACGSQEAKETIIPYTIPKSSLTVIPASIQPPFCFLHLQWNCRPKETLNYSIEIIVILCLRLPPRPPNFWPLCMTLLLLLYLNPVKRVYLFLSHVRALLCVVSLFLAKRVCSVETNVSAMFSLGEVSRMSF